MSTSIHSRDHEILALMSACANVRYNVDNSLRKYHNLNHALTVMDAIQVINPRAAFHMAIAALYHDAVYVPGAGSDANERCSAAALAVDWAKCRFSSDHPVLKKAQKLIANTSVEHHLSQHRVTTELGVLLDADLYSFTADHNAFVTNQSNIIEENGGTVGPDTLRKCALFLQQFLTVRSHIYHSDYARENWEPLARANIEWFCATY